MKDERIQFRLRDILDDIDQIHSLLEDKTFDDLLRDRFVRAAFERFIEILSEASRHIPESLKQKAQHVPWSKVGNIGNHLRHAYHRVDAEVLWNVYETGELAQLREAIETFLKSSD